MPIFVRSQSNLSTMSFNFFYPLKDNQETGNEEIFRKLGEAQQTLEKFLETGTDSDLHTKTGYSYQEPRFQTHAEFQMKMRADYAREQTERKKKEMAALMIALGLGTDFDTILVSSIKRGKRFHNF